MIFFNWFDTLVKIIMAISILLMLDLVIRLIWLYVKNGTMRVIIYSFLIMIVWYIWLFYIAIAFKIRFI